MNYIWKWGGILPERPSPSVPEEPPDPTQHQTVKAEMLAKRAAKRAQRLAQYEKIITLHQQGVKIVDIAAQVGLGRRTVERWLAHGSFPERKPRTVYGTTLDSYRDYIKRRWQAGCYNLAQIYREIQQQGYSGTYSAVYNQFSYLRRQKNQELEVPEGDATLPAPRRRYTPRQAAFLFIQDTENLDETKQEDLALILTDNPQFCQWRDLAQQFMTLLRERDQAGLDPWLDDVTTQGSGPLQRFAAGLRADYPEVSAALSYSWSNGPTEGHINKLKFLKRQMFGRAKIDLLRKRIMHRD